MSRQVKKVNISGKEDKSNKVTSWSSTTTDAHYPSEKLVKDSLDGKASSSHNHTKSQITDFPTSMTPTSHTHGNLQNNGQVGSTAQASKNVVTDSSGKITTEDKPTIPSASSTTPSADTTSGSVGTGTTWARSNHTHPKSSLYAESSHTHTKSQITDFPTIPSKTSDLTNDSGFLTTHQSLTGYLQTSDVKDNLTSTDTNKPLSALQGKELKALIDNKEDNIEIFTGSVDRVNSTSAFLKAYTTSSILEGKIILYKVPDISSIEQTTNVALDYYGNNQTTSFYRKDIYKNGVQLTFGDIESNSWILLAYDGTVSNGQWNLISSSSYAEANHTHSQYLTEHQDLSDYVTTDDSRLSDARTPTSHTHTQSQITDFPTLPTASSTVPSADTQSGSYGSGTSYARSNHTHPQSSLYAEASHTHSQYLTSHQDITGKEDSSNKVTSISSSSTDTQYPSAKCVYDKNDDLWNYVEDLDYTQIGGNLVVADEGIQAQGLEQIINQIISSLMAKSNTDHTHSGYASSSHTHGTWTSQTVATYGTLYVNTAIRMCELRYVRSFSSASADSFYEWHTGAIPSGYRPSSQVMGSINQVGAIYVDSDGDIGGKFAVGWSSSRSVIGTVMWHY